MQFGTSLSSLTQSLIISLWFDPVDYHNYPSRGYHVVSCVDYIPHLLSVPYTLTKWYQEPGYDKQRQKTKGHFQNQCSKLVASRDKKVNQAARDSDDALVCCIENTVEDRIMDSGVGDVVGKTSFGTSWTLKDVRYIPSLKRRLISVGQLDEEGYHVGFGDQQWKVTKGSLVVARGNKRGSLYMVERRQENYRDWSKFIQKAMALHLLHQSKDPATMIPLSKTAAGVVVGLHILEEEWRGKDTSLTHLKVFGCDSFVKVKDVCGEAMKCTFIGSGSDEVRYNFQDTKSHQVIRSRDITFVDSIYKARSATNSSSLTKPIQKSQVVLVDILENLTENDSIDAEHELSSEITQSPDGSSDTSEGSKNSRSFEDSERSDEEYFEDGASSKEGGFETPQEPSYVGALNDTPTQHKSKGFQLAGQEENLECRMKEILYELIQALRLRVLIFVEDSWNEEPCSDVHQVGDEREVKVLCSFNWPPSELITDDGVLSERGFVCVGYGTRLLELKGEWGWERCEGKAANDGAQDVVIGSRTR
ncbi:retrovirus-related pol polyprotein from transposon TNT 1-94 [Tanacetum coccineum]